MKTDLDKLLEDCRVEMGPKVFRQFTDDLAGRKPVPRRRTMACALCDGTGINAFKPVPCDGCDGTGKF